MRSSLFVLTAGVACALFLTACQREDAVPAPSATPATGQASPNAAVVPASPETPDPSMTGTQPQKATSPMGGNGTGNTTDPKAASENGSGNAKGTAAAPTGGDGAPGSTPKSP